MNRLQPQGVIHFIGYKIVAKYIYLFIFSKQEKKIDLEPTQSVIALPFAVALIFLLYNYDAVSQLVKKMLLIDDPTVFF